MIDHKTAPLAPGKGEVGAQSHVQGESIIDDDGNACHLGKSPNPPSEPELTVAFDRLFSILEEPGIDDEARLIRLYKYMPIVDALGRALIDFDRRTA